MNARLIQNLFSLGNAEGHDFLARKEVSAWYANIYTFINNSIVPETFVKIVILGLITHKLVSSHSSTLQHEKMVQLNSHSKSVLQPITSQSSSPIVAICTDSCGEYIATADTDSVLLLTPGRDSTQLESVSFKTVHPKSAIQNIAFAPARLHPRMVATAGSDGLVSIITISPQIHPVATSYQLEHEAPVSDVSFSDEGLLATRCNNVVHIYEYTSVLDIPTEDHPGEWDVMARVPVHDGAGLSFAPRGKFLVAGGCIMRCVHRRWHWEVSKRFNGPYDDIDEMGNKWINESFSKIRCVDWSNTGFIAIGRDNSCVEIWQLIRGELKRLAELKTKDNVSQIEWDKAGNVLAGIDTQGITYIISKKCEEEELRWVVQKCA